MMLASQLPGVYFKHLGRRLIARTLSLSSIHSGVQRNKNENIDERKAHSITQRKPLTEKQIQKIINLDNIHLESKLQKRLAEREPLVKNFFVGKVDKELLAYPQVIEIDDYQKLVETLRPVHSYFAEKSKKYFDADSRDISDELISELKRMQIFGRTVPERYGGFGYFNSEANLAAECESVDVKFAEIIAGHRLATEVISAHGTWQQKEKYLLDLGKGDLIGSVCLHDPQSETVGCITAVQDPSTSSPEWILNGSRSFVVKSRHSNLLVVTAVAEEESEYNGQPSTQKNVTFVLDPTTRGVTFKENVNTIGCTEVPFVTVEFSDVRLSEDNVLSEIHDDRTAAEQLICNSRIQTAIMNSIQTKQILNYLVKHMVGSTFNGEKIMDLEVFRHKMSKVTCDLYALESMIYLTAGIVDSYEKPKIDLETAIVKSFSLEIMSRVVKLLLDFPATSFVIKGHPSEEYIRNAIQLRFSKESEAEKLKTYIGLTGLQHCREIIGHRVKSHADSLIRTLFKGPTIEVVNCDLHLNEYIHPSFEETMLRLEESIIRMSAGTEILLHRFGLNAGERHMEIRKLGESAVRNFAMFASVARASRSYCIGLRYSVYETVIAACVVDSSADRILDMMLDIKNEQRIHEKYLQIAKSIENSQFTWPIILQSKRK